MAVTTTTWAGEVGPRIGVAAARPASRRRPAEPFDEFYRRNFRPLAGLAGSLCGNPSVGEDLAQEALWRASERWGELGSMEHRDHWVRRVTINLALSEGRRAGRAARAVSRLRPEAVPAAEPPGEELRAVRDAILSLSPSQRSAVMLAALDGASSATIARSLGCSEVMARVHLHRGRRAIREQLDRRAARDVPPSVGRVASR